MPKLLEVIVTSLDEAIEAAAGGADRLELVRAFEAGGLTPTAELVGAVTGTVDVPVRVMVRQSATLWVGSEAEVSALQSEAEQMARYRIDGFVIGFIREELVDWRVTLQVLGGTGIPVTFHRAFDEAADAVRALDDLRRVPQVDRVLTAGGEGSWAQRKSRLVRWQRAAPELTILVGAGLCPGVLDDLKNSPELTEVHVGRAARIPRSCSGVVRREAVRLLKSALE